jgi:hypothetical protein
MVGAVTSASSGGAPTTERTLESRLAVVVLVLAMGLFVALTWGHLTAPLGHSHDGRNGAVWASGSRALRDDGPLTSRLGARRADSPTYANHPPLLVWSMAASESALGERTTSSRLPVLLASLTAMALVYRICIRAGLRPMAAAAGVAGAFLCPMAVVYGVMIDTPMFSLAFGAAVILLWQRARASVPTSTVAVVAVAAAAALSGWEAALLTGIAGVVLVVGGIRSARPAERSGGLALLAGGAVGAVASVAWAWWAYGSGSVLVDQLVLRSGSDGGATTSVAFTNQVHWLVPLLGIAGLGLLLAACAIVLDPVVRALFALVLGATVLYTIVLHNGAAFHDYWNYWFILSSALGLAWGAERVGRAIDSRTSGGAPAIAALGAIAVALVLAGRLPSPEGAQSLEAGYGAGRLVESAPPGTGAVGDIGNSYAAGSWLTYVTGLPHQHLFTVAELEAFSRDHPDAPILLNADCGGGSGEELCTRAWSAAANADLGDADGRWRIVVAAQLVAAMSP